MNTNLGFLKNNLESNNLKKDETYWKIIIADDDDEVHKVTKVVLGKENFEGKAFKFISTYSGEETKKILEDNNDAAVILLDVVMEEEDSGLEVAKYIREELQNSKIRIILRTGQPGQAPENTVIRNYDINDYKEKTEMTSKKMLTSIVSALRSYRDLELIEKSKNGLEKIIKASAEVMENNSIKTFAENVLKEIPKILYFGSKIDYHEYSASVYKKEGNQFFLIAGIGKYCGDTNDMSSTNLSQECLEKLTPNSNDEIKNTYIEIFKTSRGEEYLFYIGKENDFDSIEKYLIKVFFLIITVSFKNVELIDYQTRILQELQIERERVELASRAKNDFLSNMSHELRTPLNGIFGCIELLSLEAEEETKTISSLRISSKRLLSLIENMLSYSEMQDKKQSLIEDKFRFDSLLKIVTKLQSKEIAEKGLLLNITIDEKLNCTAIGDDFKIKEILYNLLSNAVKFTEKGEININVEDISQNNDYILTKISVKDTGVGIPKSGYFDLFKPFVQGEYHLNKKYAGVGLGLAITKKLVEVMNGQIYFESEVGKGSAFFVEIPLKKVKE